MRRIRYQVASSLDGYIAGPNGEYDWIVPDPDVDSAALFAQFDTFVMGRRTYEAFTQGPGVGGAEVVVFSRTLRQEDHAGVTVTADVEGTCRRLKAAEGKDIWLFGGGVLFASMLEAGQVDSVEVAVVPVLLGGGVPLLPAPSVRRRLRLRGHRLYATSGMMLLEYDVVAEAAGGGQARTGKGTKSAARA